MTRSARRLHRSIYEWIFPLGIPLSWRQLVQEKKRFAAAVAGITFAVTMMLFQIGLQSALFTQVVAPIRQMRADIVLMSPQFEYLGSSHEFPAQLLYSAQGDPAVDTATALYLGSLPFKNPTTGRARDIFILAFNPTDKPFTNRAILAQQDNLTREGVVLFDRLSRPDYGDIAKLLAASGDGTVDSEVADRHVQIEGLFEMGVTFAADGNLLMGRDTYLHIAPGARGDEISLGLLTLKPGYDPATVAAALDKRLPDGVNVLTYDQFLEREKRYWADRTPIGFVITASMIVSLIVGAVIVYQILYTDVTDHLPEYATLKSIGFTDGYFTGLVLQESVILSVCGFVPGLGLAAALYSLTRTYAHMPAYLTLVNIALVFGMTLLMCLVAGALATRKLRQANPADIF